MSDPAPAKPPRVILFQRWQCDKCDAAGSVAHEAQDDASKIIRAAKAQHAQKNRECGGPIRFAAHAQGTTG